MSSPLSDELLLELAPDPLILLDDQARITAANAAAERLFGYPRAELVDRAFEDLVAPSSREPHARLLASLVDAGARAPIPQHLRMRVRGGERLTELRMTLGRPAGVLVVAVWLKDDDTRGDLKSQLMADRLSSAIESIRDAIALFDEQDRLVLCNSAYRRLIERTPTRPVDGRLYADLLDDWLDDIELAPPEERLHFAAQRVARASGPETVRFDLRLKDGRALRVTDQRIPEGGSVKTISNLSDDFHRAEELRSARESAESASRAKSEFLSSMSHELRTPLNAILGFAQLLLRDRRAPLPERQAGRVAHILESGEHLLRLIDDVLDLSRIEANGVSISPSPSTSSRASRTRSSRWPRRAR